MIEVAGSGVDAFVCSTNLTSPVADALASIVCDQIAGYQLEGHEVKNASQNGFEGLRVASMFYGRNADYVMIDIKGEDADGFTTQAKETSGGVQCSRIDCRVDAKGFKAGRNPARDAARRFENANFRPPGKRPLFSSLLRSSDGGFTFYTGAPASDSRNRLYDKHSEEPDCYEQGTFRWEHQARRERADNIWRGMTQSTEPRAFCLEVVKGAFEGHGADMSFLKGVEARRIVVPRPETDLETFLRWHGRCIAPTFIKYASDGNEERILAELERIKLSVEKQVHRRDLLSETRSKEFKPRGSRRKGHVKFI